MIRGASTPLVNDLFTQKMNGGQFRLNPEQRSSTDHQLRFYTTLCTRPSPKLLPPSLTHRSPLGYVTDLGLLDLHDER